MEIWVGYKYLGYRPTKQSFYKCFSTYGQVFRVRMRDGYGFVEFSYHESARDAVQDRNHIRDEFGLLVRWSNDSLAQFEIEERTKASEDSCSEGSSDDSAALLDATESEGLLQNNSCSDGLCEGCTIDDPIETGIGTKWASNTSYRYAQEVDQKTNRYMSFSCLTSLREFERKSLEELRFEDMTGKIASRGEFSGCGLSDINTSESCHINAPVFGFDSLSEDITSSETEVAPTLWNPTSETQICKEDPHEKSDAEIGGESIAKSKKSDGIFDVSSTEVSNLARIFHESWKQYESALRNSSKEKTAKLNDLQKSLDISNRRIQELEQTISEKDDVLCEFEKKMKKQEIMAKAEIEELQSLLDVATKKAKPEILFERNIAKLSKALRDEAYEELRDLKRECQDKIDLIRAEDKKERLCKICFDREKSVVLQCGHRYCQECADRISKCSFCQQPKMYVLKVFD